MNVVDLHFNRITVDTCSHPSIDASIREQSSIEDVVEDGPRRSKWWQTNAIPIPARRPLTRMI